MKNVLLFVVAILLLTLFGTISIIIATERILIGKASNRYFFECAFAVDVLGNTMGQYLWNLAFIKKQGYQFGTRHETISSVLGKNQRDDTLKWFGKLMVLILDLFEKNHCLISILKF